MYKIIGLILIMLLTLQGCINKNNLIVDIEYNYNITSQLNYMCDNIEYKL